MNTVSREDGLVWVRRRARVAKSRVHRPGLNPLYSGPVLMKRGNWVSRIDLIAFSVIFHRLERTPIGRMSLAVRTTVLLILLRRAILHWYRYEGVRLVVNSSAIRDAVT